MQLFGFSIEKKRQPPSESFAPQETDDGAMIVAGGPVYGSYTAMDGTVKTDAELITKYREMSLIPEVESAIDDIVNEAIVNEPEEPAVKVVLDELEIPDSIKKRIEDEFENVLQLLEFKSHSYEVFKKWYIDGRIYYHMIIDSDKPDEGIKECRYLDPRKIKKVREEVKRKNPRNANVIVTQTQAEYFLYNEKGFDRPRPGTIQIGSVLDQNIKIANDSIAYVTSGLMTANNDMVLSYLNKAIKPLNQLKSLEDSLIIYRISRAPERRAFYIDVGGLPRAKGEQYVKEMMTKYKNKAVYDPTSGEVRDERKFMTMLEDYWMPRRGDGKATEIQTLPGGQNLSQIDDIKYFQENLYRALGVPIGRMNSEEGFNIGRSSEISRDEIKFQKFINRLRMRFQFLFTIILGKQLILKGVVTLEDWKEFSQKIDYKFAIDNFFAELKDLEIKNERYALLGVAAPFAGSFISHETLRKDILRQTDDDIAKEDALIKKEMDNPQYMASFQTQTDQANQDMDRENEVEQSKPIKN